MAKYPGGVTVSGYIAPSDTLDTYATHKANFGQGGYRSVLNIEERDLITDIRREIGMVVYVISEDKEYRLIGGIENTNWREIIDLVGGGSGGGPSNYIIVNTLSDIENYPQDDREIGMVFYATDVDREFRLVHGIENSHLVEKNLVPITQVQNNHYYNTFGCLNKALIMEAILDKTSDFQPIYTNPDGEEVVSGADTNIFSFVINKSEYWAGDWIYFKGSAKIDQTKINETFIEITRAGSTEIININLALAGTKYVNFEIFGTQSKWYGYFRNPNPGKINLKVYETQDGIPAFNINKTVYLFAPNFSIKDGESNTPLDITRSLLDTTDKEYTIDVIGNTSLVMVLARVNVTAKGIDTSAYTSITSTMVGIKSDGKFVIPYAVLNNLIDGTYSLIVTGSDGGVNIPPYFYGPFVINNN